MLTNKQFKEIEKSILESCSDDASDIQKELIQLIAIAVTNGIKKYDELSNNFS